MDTSIPAIGQRRLDTGVPAEPRTLSRAPAELKQVRLRRLGEGIGKVIYASEHWVVKRERTAFDVVALIILWRVLRIFKHMLPRPVGRWLIRRPARQIRLLRVMLQGVMTIVPSSIWLTRHVKQLWKLCRTRDWRGEELAEQHLRGTALIPRRVTFPPTRVQVRGWPGSLTVSEATERVDATLFQRLATLARQGRFEELEGWLDRFLETRQSGWKQGVFSMDSHLKNFGVIGSQIVLLDTGGLTDKWAEIDQRLAYEERVGRPHIKLGLGPILRNRPDIATRFNTAWKATVNRSHVRGIWPSQPGGMNPEEPR